MTDDQRNSIALRREHRTITRRSFVGESVALAGGLCAGAGTAAVRTETQRGKILNYNSQMEYRRLGKTGMMVSAVCLGGHWKRVEVALNRPFTGSGASKEDFENIKASDFLKNRHDVISRCIDVGINYVDACSPMEILAYAKVLKGRRDKFYFGYSWHLREPRFLEWRTSKKLIEGLDAGLKEAGLDYVDVWRISLPQERIADLGELLRVEEATAEGLEKAKQQGKARFTGVSTHNRVWLKSVIEEYPKQMEVVLFPYTADSKQLPDDSVFDAIHQHDVGVFGIKPFADNALFRGDGSPNSAHAEEDSRRARLALRYILSNTAITAPIPGLVTLAQVDNVVKAIAERRAHDLSAPAKGTRRISESIERQAAAREMWANLSPDHGWLKNWEYV
jgi:predicted aldo/keto reductase-like oxidoreductase